MKVVISDCNFAGAFEEEKKVCDRAGFNLEIYQHKEEDKIIEVAKDADALLVQYGIYSDRILSQLNNAKVIVRYGIGVDNIDLEAAKKYGIAVCNVPDYGIAEVADHAASLAVSLGRQLPFWHNSIIGNQWPASTPTTLKSFSDMNFVVLGAGRIGRETIKRMQAFGFKCYAYDPYVSQAVLSGMNVQKVELEEAIKMADILSLHLPHTPETHHLINQERLSKMKPTATLINTSRGALIHTKELADALNQGEIANAGIDVFEAEPMEGDHPLRTAKNILMTPHISYYSEASVRRLQRYAAEEVERTLNGEALRCQVV
ncbi:C-terminal binding protein [Flammeovirga sp. SJP92]|uniref:C-terminal binding protein n=1 Tax=Flammeovirga sp. SJP92 TaxID=1775430 RepID=UPI000789595F|nr:C-terminal binding protein [Flammeovirga sp. SJP92]KXX69592.1 hypothetical protein AVL50_16125 [Flammeovirga sp. SJP92]